MTFDQTVLIWCVIVPAVIAAVGCLATKVARQSPPGLAAALGWWLAVAAAMAGLQGWQWWPEESWRQAIWPLLAWVIMVGVVGRAGPRYHADRDHADRDHADRDHADRDHADLGTSSRWVLVGLLAIATGMLAMPGGEGWEDTFRLHRIWIGLVAASCLVNGFALEQLSRTGGNRWSLLVALAGLAGPMAFAGATYGSLAQWSFAMIVATTVVAAFAIFAESDSRLWAVSIPATVGAAGITAAGRFYSYETHPSWVYAVMLFLPAAITLSDALVIRKSNWLRVLVSGLVATAAVAACVWQLLLR